MKQDKTKPIFGLKKIPNSILLKMALVENGKLKAYIDELEYENKKLREGAPPDATTLSEEEQKRILVETRKEELYKELKAMNKDLWERNKKLKNRLDELLMKMLRNENDNEQKG